MTRIEIGGYSFECSAYRDLPSGGNCDEYTCCELPRLTLLRQRAKATEPMVETWHVRGLPQVFRTLELALEALRFNPA